MGEVFKAYQADLHRHVAIKTLLSGEQASEEFLQRFQREARMAAKLSHPNIVPIYDIGAEGSSTIVREYVDVSPAAPGGRNWTPKCLKIVLPSRGPPVRPRAEIIHRGISPPT
jgi:serine/threonine protein kinase